MIKIFGATDKIYTSNGDKVINPIKAKVHKEDNGDYYLELETDLSYIDYIVPNNIVVAPTPQGEQAFRIGNVEKNNFRIKTKAWHIYYDSENYLIQDSNVVDGNCNYALDHLNSATDTTSPFNTSSNITTINSYRCVRASLNEAVMTCIEKWGGHLIRDNWNIAINGTIGQDNGVVVRYGKNLKDITATYNWDNVVTKLLPVGKDGLLLNALDPTVDVYITSETQYDIPYTKTVSFSQNINEKDYQDTEGNTNETAFKTALLEDLRNQAYAYLNDNCIPKVNYTLSANIEKVTDIGDTIEVIDERLGLELMTNIISFEYDCILGKYTKVEFGSFTQSLKGLISGIKSSTSSAISSNNNAISLILGQELQQAQDKIWNALGSSYCIYEGDKILIVDTLPKESATNVIMINNGGIAFSNTGINGNFTSAWTIDNTLNMQNINVINLVADMIKGGTLKLGSNLNQNGIIEVYDEANTLIAQLTKDGLKMYGMDGSYLVINNEVGLVGYDKDGTREYWVEGDEFHMKKSVVEEEITLFNKARWIPITIYDDNHNVTNDGIGLVAIGGGS